MFESEKGREREGEREGGKGEGEGEGEGERNQGRRQTITHSLSSFPYKALQELNYSIKHSFLMVLEYLRGYSCWTCFV